jgi:hypothetical protein
VHSAPVSLCHCSITHLCCVGDAHRPGQLASAVLVSQGIVLRQYGGFYVFILYPSQAFLHIHSQITG